MLNLSKMAVGGVTHWRAMLVSCTVTAQPCTARKGKLLTRNPHKISTVGSRCCLRSFSDLTQELPCVLGTWLTFQLVRGLTDFTNWVPLRADFFFFSFLKAKSREPRGNFLHEWEAELLE